MKYVRHEHKGFFLFPRGERVFHSQVGRFLGLDGIISAGFVKFDSEGKPECYGYSESLQLGGAHDDTEVLRNEWTVYKKNIIG